MRPDFRVTGACIRSVYYTGRGCVLVVLCYRQPRGNWKVMPFEKFKGNVEPPDEAYSRVTNPERFRPLHQAVLEMLDALETRFDVERVEGHGLDEEMERFSRQPSARPTITLKPIYPESASITIVFTDFPGLHIRFGRWFTDSFPSCGCDAGDESAEGEIERVTELIDSVTSGGFRETVIHSPVYLTSTVCNIIKQIFTLPMRRYPSKAVLRRRVARYSSLGVDDIAREDFAPLRDESIQGSRTKAEFRGPSFGQSSGSLLNDDRALELTGGQPSLLLDWKPWPVRPEKAETGE